MNGPQCGVAMGVGGGPYFAQGTLRPSSQHLLWESTGVKAMGLISCTHKMYVCVDGLERDNNGAGRLWWWWGGGVHGVRGGF